MKTKEELEEAFKDSLTRYQEVMFGSGTPASMNFESGKSLTKNCTTKS